MLNPQVFFLPFGQFCPDARPVCPVEDLFSHALRQHWSFSFPFLFLVKIFLLMHTPCFRKKIFFQNQSQNQLTVETLGNTEDVKLKKKNKTTLIVLPSRVNHMRYFFHFTSLPPCINISVFLCNYVSSIFSYIAKVVFTVYWKFTICPALHSVFEMCYVLNGISRYFHFTEEDIKAQKGSVPSSITFS